MLHESKERNIHHNLVEFDLERSVEIVRSIAKTIFVH